MKFKNWPRDQDPHLFRLMVVNLCLYSQRRYWTGSGRVSIVVLTDSYRPLRSQESKRYLFRAVTSRLFKDVRRQYHLCIAQN